MRRRHEIHEHLRLTGERPIFRPSPETELAGGLMWQPVENKEEFRELIDLVYKSVYEASGNGGQLQKLFKTSHGAVDNVRLLRHQFFHDPSREREDIARTKAIRTGELYRNACGSPSPKTREEWQQVQLELLIWLKSLYSDIIKALQGSV